jgi:hypothetical protein
MPQGPQGHGAWRMRCGVLYLRDASCGVRGAECGGGGAGSGAREKQETRKPKAKNQKPKTKTKNKKKNLVNLVFVFGFWFLVFLFLVSPAVPISTSEGFEMIHRPRLELCVCGPEDLRRKSLQTSK